ncbi:MAG TPA: hypothetical protein VMS76_19600 [Planctomycetota bacterium]|nr:hypothetical protein [Planctomycetota bacterium]
MDTDLAAKIRTGEPTVTIAGNIPPPGWIHEWRGARKETEEVPLLTDQFFATLRAAAAEVEQLAGKPPSRPLERVRLLLEKGQNEPTWLDAYEIEQQLVHLMPAAKLGSELRVRLVEAHSVLKPAKAQAYGEAVKCAKTDPEQRGLLSRLVNDLQWTYTVNEAKRQFWGTLTRRTAWMLAICAGAFLVSMFLVQVAPRDAFPWLSVAQWSTLEFHPLSWKSLLLVCAAGAWGASFSMLLGLKKVDLKKVSLDQLKVMLTRGVFLARMCIGAGGALVLLFFMVSGILSGTVFPEFTAGEPVAGASATTDLIVNSKSVVLLVLWCFIAGFSEKLVPGLLADSERRAAGSRAERQPGEVERPAIPATLQPSAGEDGGDGKQDKKG